MKKNSKFNLYIGNKLYTNYICEKRMKDSNYLLCLWRKVYYQSFSMNIVTNYIYVFSKIYRFEVDLLKKFTSGAIPSKGNFGK